MTKTIAIIGPSCSGKDTVRDGLLALGVPNVPTYTTRPPRVGECGCVYLDIDQWCDRARRMKEFVETASYKVDGGDIWCYGWRKADFESENGKGKHPIFKTVVVPMTVCQLLIQQDLIHAVILLECNPFTAFYRYLSRDDGSHATLFDREIVRRIGQDMYDFNVEHVSAFLQFANENRISVYMYDTTPGVPDAKEILYLLEKGLKYE